MTMRFVDEGQAGTISEIGGLREVGAVVGVQGGDVAVGEAKRKG